MISTANITMQFGEKLLFEDISVKFSSGKRYGLIGANGCGKSTFMKILGSDLEQTGGTVSVDENERIGKLKQDQFAYETFSVVDTVIMGQTELWSVKKERDCIYALPAMTETEGMLVSDLEIKFGEMDGYTAEARAGELLLGLEIPVEQHCGLMSEVAPGWKLRVLLAQALFSDPDILLLDEPTNNLDMSTISWLENILNERKSTMVIISHDRHFLNSVCTHIADLDYGELRLYPGNYDQYMTASTMVRDQLLSDNAKKQGQINELKAFVSRFSANASKAKQATSRAKLIDKIELSEVKASSRVNPFIRFEQDKKLFRLVLEVSKFHKTYVGENGSNDNQVLKDINLMLEVKDSLGVIGANGVGKTTFLKSLMGEEALTSGTIKWSENVKLGYYAQDHAHNFEEDMSLIDWMGQWKQPSDDEQALRSVLGRLLFSQKDIDKSVKVLSGGEQGRMLFGKLMLQKPNVLIMDEPTNHLDMESIESLNQALVDFPGTLIFVTHDREFVSSLATRLLILNKDGTHTDFRGDYDAYLQTLA